MANTETKKYDRSGFVTLTGFKKFQQAGDEVLGVYVGSTHEANIPLPGDIHQYLFHTEDGLFKLNETAQLSVLRSIPKGTEVLIVYNGEAEQPTRQGFKVRKFDVMVKREELSSVAKALLAAAPSEVTADVLATAADPFAAD